MGVYDLFSKRRKKDRGELPDVFTYDRLPQQLRVQIVHILRDALGAQRDNEITSDRAKQKILDTLSREYGTFTIAPGQYPQEILENFIIDEPDTYRVLDAVELSFMTAEMFGNDAVYRSQAEVKLLPKQAIAELNERFLEHGIGYQYDSCTIIRKDSEFLHLEAVKPTLQLLRDHRFKGANDEFLKAHEHYRHGKVKDCMTYCLMAFESVLKTICAIKSWEFQPTDTAKSLLDICFQKDLVPAFLQSHYAALRSTLESGVPTVRNKLGAHGQGAEVIEVPLHYAAYTLHMTASTVLFLVECAQVR